MRAAVGAVAVAGAGGGRRTDRHRPADLLRLVHGVGAASETDPSSAERLLSYVLDGIRPQPPRLPVIVESRRPHRGLDFPRSPVVTSCRHGDQPAAAAIAVTRTSACIRPSGMPSAPSDSPSTHTHSPS